MLRRNIMNKNSFLSLYNKIEGYNSRSPEILCFIIYILSVITLSFFHEPWFDEFQAWGISRASIHDILFVIPHFEVHPPLWHLVLKCFSSFNLPAELCIKIPNLIFVFASVWLIIFKSPFPRVVRLTLPFTYFIFYQYAVISRPYSMLMFALLLSALFYKEKDSRPFRFIATLGFLSLTSLYGMVLATGITLAWVYEIWDKQNFVAFLRSFVKDKRFFAMLGLFFLCLLLAIEIFPDEQKISFIPIHRLPILLRSLYAIFGTIADATITDFLNLSNLTMINPPKLVFAFSVVIGGCIYWLLYREFYKQKCVSFIFILFFLSLFYIKYIWPHHLGIQLIFLITIFWIISEKNVQKIKFSKPIIGLIILTIMIQFSWSILSFVSEIKCDYSPSRQLSSYVKLYSLNEYKLFSSWASNYYYTDEKGKKIYFKEELKVDEKYEKVLSENIDNQVLPILINPYFNKNLFSNFRIDNPNALFLPHLAPTDEQTEIIKKRWAKNGKSDFIFADFVTTEQPFYKYLRDYYLLQIFNAEMIWKGITMPHTSAIYVREDLYLDIKEKIRRIDEENMQKDKRGFRNIFSR